MQLKPTISPSKPHRPRYFYIISISLKRQGLTSPKIYSLSKVLSLTFKVFRVYGEMVTHLLKKDEGGGVSLSACSSTNSLVF